VVIILFMFVTVIQLYIVWSVILCEWLLYCSCVVTSMQLYTYNETFTLHSGKYDFYTTILQLII